QGISRGIASVLVQDGDGCLSEGRRRWRLRCDDEHRRALLQRRRRAPGPRAGRKVVREVRSVQGKGSGLAQREGGQVQAEGRDGPRTKCRLCVRRRADGVGLTSPPDWSCGSGAAAVERETIEPEGKISGTSCGPSFEDSEQSAGASVVY